MATQASLPYTAAPSLATDDSPLDLDDLADDLVQVRKRDNTLVDFDTDKIQVALQKAWQATYEEQNPQILESTSVRQTIRDITTKVETEILVRYTPVRPVQIEEIQDRVEIELMKANEFDVARRYIVYRNERTKVREARTVAEPAAPPVLHVRLPDGSRELLDLDRVQLDVTAACAGLEGAAPSAIMEILVRDIYDDITPEHLRLAQIMAARSLVEQEPVYSAVSARLVLLQLRSEVVPFICGPDLDPDEVEDTVLYQTYFPRYIRKGIDLELIHPELARFDLDRLARALQPERDRNFQFLGMQTLYDRYFLHSGGTRIELPQAFFMRVAMGLAQAEDDREERAIEFYHLLSSFDFMCSTPTLFNAGTPRPQLSSCFLSTVPDDLDSIFKSIKDNALLSKFSGGLGNDWTPVRGLGAHIKGTNGHSQGVVPFLKVANDTAVAVNQGGKRKGAVCAYLETWHIDIDEFLDLRKNTGDERRRTHDMNTACWVPDLFMERVAADEGWTLFSPDETPDLHDLVGLPFKERYLHYEARVQAGEMKVYKHVRALDLWRRMLTMLFETGHPWITFKDPCNLRSPQQHAGVVHSSNLCTEITLNSNAEEVAVCNLGSVNLARHVTDGQLDQAKLQQTVATAMRMLDNVIDINFYTIPETRNSNLRHRPVGMGIMGFQDVLQQLKIPYASRAAVDFADRSMEAVSYHAISASADLARERGAYQTFAGSLWSRGVLPIDSLDLLDRARNRTLEVDRTQRMDWEPLRTKVRQQGMRNSNVMAIAPTATIANICGVSPSIEPTFRNLFVKANMSGDFTVVNEYLVRDLKARGLWDAAMVSDLKFYDGSLSAIDRVPADLKQLYATAFEIDPAWLVEAGARRQKWIDQSQSLNLYVATTSGQQLHDLYTLAWKRGLKTTYYLRTQAATQVEKSTLQGTDGKLNAVPVAPQPDASLSPRPLPPETETLYSHGAVAVQDGLVCHLDDEDCEACQ